VTSLTGLINLPVYARAHACAEEREKLITGVTSHVIRACAEHWHCGNQHPFNGRGYVQRAFYPLCPTRQQLRLRYMARAYATWPG
jgi:hypothetical protein